MHFQCIALDEVWNPLPGLFGAVSVKLNPIAKHLCNLRDGLERHTITDARIDRSGCDIRKQEESPNALGFL
jgi:hypothetical protein